MRPKAHERFERGKQAGRKALAFLFILVSLAAVLAFCARRVSARQPRQGTASEVTPAVSPFVDVHTHLDPTDIDASVQTALRMMSKENAARILFLASPSTFSMDPKDRFDSELLLSATKKYPGKFGVLGGGG